MRKTIAALTGAFVLAAHGTAYAQQFEQGRSLYDQHCSLCHGKDGRGGVGFKTPLWGAQTQITKFDTALAMFEYNQLLMPFNDPSLVTDDQKWAIVQFILVNHGTIKQDQQLGPGTAGSIRIK